MLWPLVQPFLITCCICAVVVAAGVAIAPYLKRSRKKTFVALTALSFVGFIPSCVGVTTIVDSYRFGTFQYSTFEELRDFRIERYIPKEARTITLNKYASGHRAKYTVSEIELKAHLDHLWAKAGQHSVISREKPNVGALSSADQMQAEFGDLNWPILQNAVELHSPVAGNGAGATYYFSKETSMVYQRAGYW
jgi:hypothetical protein